MTIALPRRHLVLTTEAARHPFRASLPPHVCEVAAENPARPQRRNYSRQDWRQFLGTYCACFAVVTAFIA